MGQFDKWTYCGTVRLMAPVASTAGRVCSITDALSVFGDRYSLLIVREIGYRVVRFNELKQGTGAPGDVLSARLKRLEALDVIERRRYAERPPRYEYHLTDAGHDLRPIVLAIKEWGDLHINPGSEPVVFEHACGAQFHPHTVCASCGEPVEPGDLRIVGGTDAVVGTEW